MTVRLTDRDIQLFELLAVAGWLSTRQIQYALFPDTIAKVVNKRMLKLVSGGYTHKVRLGRTDQNLYRLGTMGKRVLCKEADFPECAVLQMREPPRELAHFMAINDLRLMFENRVQSFGGHMKFFFTDLELRKKRDRSPLIPDAITRFSLGDKDYRFAIEYDNGTETPRYFARQKIRKYIRIADSGDSLFRLTSFRVLVFAENFRLALKLMKGSIGEHPPSGLCYFSAITGIGEQDVLGDIYLDPTDAFSARSKGSEPETQSGGRSGIPWRCLKELVSRGGVSRHQAFQGNSFVCNGMRRTAEPNIPSNHRQESCPTSSQCAC